MPKELRNTGPAIDLFLTTVLIAIYREDYSLSMFLLTQPVAFLLALAYLDIVRGLK